MNMSYNANDHLSYNTITENVRVRSEKNTGKVTSQVTKRTNFFTSGDQIYTKMTKFHFRETMQRNMSVSATLTHEYERRSRWYTFPLSNIRPNSFPWQQHPYDVIESIIIASDLECHLQDLSKEPIRDEIGWQITEIRPIPFSCSPLPWQRLKVHLRGSGKIGPISDIDQHCSKSLCAKFGNFNKIWTHFVLSVPTNKDAWYFILGQGPGNAFINPQHVGSQLNFCT